MFRPFGGCREHQYAAQIPNPKPVVVRLPSPLTSVLATAKSPENHVWEGRARDRWEDPCTADGLRERRSCPPGGRTWTQVHLTEAVSEPQLPAGNLSGYSWHLTRSCAVGTWRRPTHLFFLLNPAPPGEGIRVLAQLPQDLPCAWARERQVADCPSSTGMVGQRGFGDTPWRAFFLTQTKYPSRLKNYLSFFKVMGTVFIDFSFRLENYLSWYILL